MIKHNTFLSKWRMWIEQWILTWTAVINSTDWTILGKQVNWGLRYTTKILHDRQNRHYRTFNYKANNLINYFGQSILIQCATSNEIKQDEVNKNLLEHTSWPFVTTGSLIPVMRLNTGYPCIWVKRYKISFTKVAWNARHRYNILRYYMAPRKYKPFPWVYST